MSSLYIGNHILENTQVKHSESRKICLLVAGLIEPLFFPIQVECLKVPNLAFSIFFYVLFFRFLDCFLLSLKSLKIYYFPFFFSFGYTRWCCCVLYELQLRRFRLPFIILITKIPLQRWLSDTSERSVKLFHLSFID